MRRWSLAHSASPLTLLSTNLPITVRCVRVASQSGNLAEQHQQEGCNHELCQDANYKWMVWTKAMHKLRCAGCNRNRPERERRKRQKTQRKAERNATAANFEATMASTACSWRASLSPFGQPPLTLAGRQTPLLSLVPFYPIPTTYAPPILANDAGDSIPSKP